MKITRFVLLALLIPCLVYSRPAQVIIIRHGEKEDNGDYLDSKGKERAEALVEYFKNDPLVLDFGLPVALFAAKPCPEDPSFREIETLTPLANTLHMQIHTPYHFNEVVKMATYVLNHENYEGKMVLICWEHTMIDQLAYAFGVAAHLPKYPGHRFDLVYKITYPPSDPLHPFFCLGLQKLMFDDSDTPPKKFPLCH